MTGSSSSKPTSTSGPQQHPLGIRSGALTVTVVAAYELSMMVALLLYTWAQGVRSSRAIERACIEDVAFRVIAAQQRPDYATIARSSSATNARWPSCSAKSLRCAPTPAWRPSG